MVFKIFGTSRSYQQHFRQGIKNALKCLPSALILIILHWTYNALKRFKKCPQDLLLIIIQALSNSKAFFFQLWEAAACPRAPSAVQSVNCKLRFREFTATSGRWYKKGRLTKC